MIEIGDCLKVGCLVFKTSLTREYGVHFEGIGCE